MSDSLNRRSSPNQPQGYEANPEMHLGWLQGLILTEFSCELAAPKGKQSSTLLVLTEGLRLTDLQGQQPHSALTPTKSSKGSSCSLLHCGNAGKHLEPQPGVGLGQLICPQRVQQSQDWQQETESSHKDSSYRFPYKKKKSREEAQQSTDTSFQGTKPGISPETLPLAFTQTLLPFIFYPEFLISRRDVPRRTCPPPLGGTLQAGAGTRGCRAGFGKGWGGTGSGKVPPPAS